MTSEKRRAEQPEQVAQPRLWAPKTAAQISTALALPMPDQRYTARRLASRRTDFVLR
ncbi:MAG: hypothetical protein MK363_12980 [Pseudomonas sp.]|nr:hypothetical protein [Pseudomonas sp.]